MLMGRLPIPVISVGNLTWGGTGKTPMVECLARHLLSVGVCPLILMRVGSLVTAIRCAWY